MNNNLLYTIYTNFFNIEKKPYNKFLLESKGYNKHLIGIYDISLNIWYNAWTLQNYNYDEIKLAKGLLNYLLEKDLNNKQNSINDNIIKSLILNSKIYIFEELQLNLIIAIFIFYTKIKIYTINKIDNLVYYYGIKSSILA